MWSTQFKSTIPLQLSRVCTSTLVCTLHEKQNKKKTRVSKSSSTTLRKQSMHSHRRRWSCGDGQQQPAKVHVHVDPAQSQSSLPNHWTLRRTGRRLSFCSWAVLSGLWTTFYLGQPGPFGFCESCLCGLLCFVWLTSFVRVQFTPSNGKGKSPYYLPQFL